MFTEAVLPLVALAIVVHILVTPLVLIVMVRRLQRRVDDLEAGRSLAPQARPEPAQVPPEPVQPVAAPPVPQPVAPMAISGAETQPESEPAPLVSRLVPALRRMGLLPPAEAEGTREAVLMQWWLPRIGGLLALLSALFFGVYINQDTAPWFKCLELLLVSAGIAVGGRFLERRYAGFGGVLVVTGLIMLYLTSVAAYVLPATRVITHPLAGALVQASVLALICAIGLLRRSALIILLAFYFSIFMGLFMVWEGLREGALIAAASLLVAGLLIARKAALERLLWVVIPGTYLIGLSFAGFLIFHPVSLPQPVSLQVFICGVTAALALAWLGGWLGSGRAGHLRLALATSLAVAAAGIVFRVVYPLELEWSMLSLGLVLLAAGVSAWAMRGCAFAAQLFLVKAAFLLGVFVVLHYSGDVRWMVLALETIVLAVTARRSRRVALEAAVWFVAVASFHYYFQSLNAIPAAGSFVWWMMAAYPAVLLVAFSLLLPPFDTLPFSWQDVSRKWLYGLLPAVAAVVWQIFLSRSAQTAFSDTLAWLMVSYLFGAMGLAPILSRWMLGMTALIAFIAASLTFWGQPFGLIEICLLLLAATMVLYLVRGQASLPVRLLRNAIHALTVTGLSLFFLQLLADNPTQAALLVALGYLLLLVGRYRPFADLGAYAFLPLLVLVISETGWNVGPGWQALALAAGMALILLPRMREGFSESLGWSALRLWSLSGPVVLWLFAAVCFEPEARWLAVQSLLVIPGAFLLMAAWRLTDGGYFIGSLLFLFTAFLRHINGLYGLDSVHAPWLTDVLASAGLLYAYVVLWFELRPSPFEIRDAEIFQRVDTLLSLACGAAFFLVTAITFYYEPLGMRPWFTPLLALSSFILILTGLLRQDTPIRRLGLLLLLVPLIRLFMVDVKDVLHRILAFAAAAILLTLLGYLYNKLSVRLQSEPSGHESPDQSDQ